MEKKHNEITVSIRIDEETHLQLIRNIAKKTLEKNKAYTLSSYLRDVIKQHCDKNEK